MLVAGIVLLGLWSAGGPLQAASDSAAVLPSSNDRATSGLSLSLRSRWPNGFGYRPIRVTASSLRPNRQERRLQVTVTPGSWQTQAARHSGTAELVLPAGATTAEVDILVPQECRWDHLRVVTREDGELLEDLSVANSWLNISDGTNWDDVANPAILVVDRDADRQGQQQRNLGQTGSESLPNIFRLAPLMDGSSNQRVAALGRDPAAVSSDWDVRNALRQIGAIDLRPPDDLPADVLAYASIDFLIMTWDELKYLAETEPDVWSAMRDAVARGGNLLVFGLGDEYQELDELNALLSPGEAEAGQSDVSPWLPPDPENYNQPLPSGPPTLGVLAYGTSNPQRGWTQEQYEQLSGMAANIQQQPPSTDAFRIRPLSFGQVVACKQAEFFAANDITWDWLLSQLGAYQLTWGARHGFGPGQADRAFFDYLIQGVGAAPVKSYLGMITVFAIIIGPVNYWLLRRAGRIPLLLITVPLGAALVICGLGIYAVTADGFATRVRMRSFTLIDRDNGEAISWSRQTYYSGVAPSGGLRFPRSSEVAAIYSHDLHARSPKSWEIRWEDDSQRLANGFLNSRTFRQFMVTHQAPSDARLEVSQQGAQVRNQLGVPLRYLLVKVSDDEYFWGESVREDEPLKLAPLARAEVQDRLRAYLQSDGIALQAPVGLEQGLREESWWFGSRRYGWDPWRNFSFVDITSILELHLDTVERIEDLPPKSYLAISDQRPAAVPMGVRSGREVSSLHVIQGSWK